MLVQFPQDIFLECSSACDCLYIYDGDSVSHPVLKAICGPHKGEYIITIHREYVCVYVCMYSSLTLCISGDKLSTTVGLSQVNFGRNFSPLLPFLRTIELPFVVITYNDPQRYAKHYVQLLTTSRVFSSIVPTYVTQGRR